MIQLTPELIRKYSVEGPRYTSYPTAPVWTSDFLQDDAALCFKNFNDHKRPVSLYIHIPFCTKRCLYCACNVTIRKQKDAVGDEYLSYLDKEMTLVLSHFDSPLVLKQLHLGGGTPTYLNDDQLTRLNDMINHRFNVKTLGEKAIEIDPRTVDHDRLAHLKQLGFNRVSFGVQDIHADVQKAVVREQSIEDVRAMVASARSLNFDSVNIDLIYGLPLQNFDRFDQTIDEVLHLSPDRIALFNYAFVPWLHSHQNALTKYAFPDDDEKTSIFINARKRLIDAGYVAIAMDHFAKKDDELSVAYENGIMKRNFMGYATQATEDYLGFGTSSIGYFNSTFLQNEKDIKAYYKKLDDEQLPLVKGYSLSKDDLIRQAVISQLMCQFKLDVSDLEKKYTFSFRSYFESEWSQLIVFEKEGFISLNETHIQVEELGKLFIRNICMVFDAYLKNQKRKNQFSKTL